MNPESPAQRQTALVERYSVIPDPHERMAALTSRKAAGLIPLPPEQRHDACLVPGCISRVWLVGSFEQGCCRFQVDSESTMVKGLARVLCEIYDDATPQDILATEPTIFEDLGINKNLTPTRLNGLANVRQRIREFALQFI
jgi:cysteine desulfuration protein SufE